MIAVIFEVTPAEGRKDAYLDIAARLKPTLEQIDGFISVERFQSLSNPEKMLSLSFFRDEAAVQEWRRVEASRRPAGRTRAPVCGLPPAHRQRGTRLRPQRARGSAGR